MHEPAHVWVQGRHRLRRRVQDRHRQPAHDHRLGHLDADVAATDDHGALRTVRQRRDHRAAVVKRLHAEHAFGVYARDGRARGDRTGADHELVEANALLLGVGIADGDRARIEIEPDRFVVQPHVDPAIAVLLRRAGNEVLAGIDDAADPVRDAAGRVRDRAAPFERDHLECVPPHPLGLACRRHAGGIAADHKESLHHVGRLGPRGQAGC